MQDTLYISQRVYFKKCEEILHKLKKFSFNQVIAIARGGLIIGGYFASKLDLPIDVVYAQSYKGTQRGRLKVMIPKHISLRGKRVLLVDDLTDSEETMSFVIQELFKKKPKQIVPVTLYRKSISVFRFINEHAEYTRSWVVFFYEPEFKTLNSQ